MILSTATSTSPAVKYYATFNFSCAVFRSNIPGKPGASSRGYYKGKYMCKGISVKVSYIINYNQS